MTYKIFSFFFLEENDLQDFECLFVVNSKLNKVLLGKHNRSYLYLK